MANFNQSLVFNGLGTLSFTLPLTAPTFFASGKISCPQLSEGASVPSQVLLTINQNGSPIYTGQAGAEGFYCNFAGTIGDVMAFVFSSALAADQQLNVIKSTIGIGTGQ